LRGIISTEEAGDYPTSQPKYKPKTVFDAIDSKVQFTTQIMPTNEEVETISELEVLMLRKLIVSAEADEGNVCLRLKIASLDFVPKAMYSKLIEKLQRQTAEVAARELAADAIEEDTTVSDFFDEETNEST